MTDRPPADRAGDAPASSTSTGAELGSYIREQRRLGRLSLRKLAELAGVSNPYLSQIERGLRRPSADILRRIAEALSISAESLYVRAGILDERRDGVDVVGEIRRDPHLSADQREALVRVYRSFRAENDESGRGGAGDDLESTTDGAG